MRRWRLLGLLLGVVSCALVAGSVAAGTQAQKAGGEGADRVVIMLRYPGMTQAQYQQVQVELRRGGQPAVGEVLSVVGSLEGDWQVVDIWESEAVFQSYMQAQVRPVLQRLGIREPAITVFPLYEFQIKG
jgi:hypothetical protein